jgi:hypothetical protein
MSSVLYERLTLPPGVEAESLGEVALPGKRHAIHLVRLGAAATPPDGLPA